MDAIVNYPQRFMKDDLAFQFWCSEVDENALLVDSFSVNEGLFEMTSIEASLVSHDHGVDLHKLIDAPATITVLSKYHGEPRYFSGVIAEAVRMDEGHHRTAYSVVILPRLHRLGHGSDCRIFQQKSVVEIAKETLERYGVKDMEWHMSREHEKREYLVQYRESHLAFLQRICAEEGIFFYQSNGPDGKHTLHFHDDSRTLPKNEHQETLEYNAISGGNVKGTYCQSFQLVEKMTTNAVTQRDYTFKNPGYKQQHTHKKQEDNGSANEYEWFDYPGGYKRDASGKPFTQSLMESIRVDATTGTGITNALHMHSGHKFELEEHDLDRFNIKYLILSATFSGTQPGAWEEDAPDDGLTSFNTTFKVMPSRLPYKPPQKTRPVVDGPQIAHVVGPEGEEIYTDSHGRIKVRFNWDRYAKGDETCSCWVRVTQHWAGTKWGFISIPRIGQEVVIDFLEGDPSQPLCVGKTFHAVNQVPYELPAHKTKMVIRSDSHKAQGYNEISFEDEGGQENMFFHAQKDMTFKVLNNRAKRVEANQTESIGANKNIEVGGNHAEKIGGSLNMSVGGGSGGALMGALGAVLAAGGKDGAAGAAATGNGDIGTFMSGIAAAGAVAEAANSAGNAGFNAAGDHFTDAGLAQQGAAASLGGILSSIMPMSGIVSSVIEKFKTTTIGMAKTEQIGVMKNTSVGHTVTEQVGKFKKTTVGDEYTIEVGKSKMVMKKDGTIIIKGVTFHFEADGQFQQLGKVIDLN